MVERLEASPDGKTIAAVHYRQDGEAKTAVAEAGHPGRRRDQFGGDPAALAAPKGKGLANSSDQVGRNFMNHNSRGRCWRSTRAAATTRVYQKTLMLNDYYLGDGKGGKPLGNVQLLGKINGDILKANVRLAPKFALDFMAGHAVDWYLMCEDLPDPESRIMVDGDEHRAAVAAHQHAVAGRPGEGDARESCAPAAIRSCCRGPSTSARRRINAARCAWATIRPTRRSIPGAAPSTTATCSSSMAASCRPRRRSIRR